jgi:virginiamycin B lyase
MNVMSGTTPIGRLRDLALALALVLLGGSVAASENPVEEVELPDDLSSAQSLIVDQAGRVWFAEKVGKTLAVFDPVSEEFSRYSLPPSWGDVGFSRITLSADGEIWFTVNRWAENAEEPYMLGKFSPADGYFTRYVLSIESIPEELLVDDGGVIWFTASNKNSLYRVDPADFAVKGYPLPTANAYPRHLAIDGKGQIWFAEANVNKIGKFIPEQERFHEYEVPTRFANPGAIAIDQSDKVWFVEMQTNRIAVFYPDWLRFDEALIPTKRSSPSAIAVDGQGNIWFLEYRANKIGVFNPQTAAFNEFDIPNFNSLPGELAIDLERSVLWFSEGSTEAKRLGSLSIDEALAQAPQQDVASREGFSNEASGAEAQRHSLAGWLVVVVGLIAGVAVVAGRARHMRRSA